MRKAAEAEAGRPGKPKKSKKSPLQKKLYAAALLLCILAGLVLLVSRPLGVFITNRQHENAIREYIEAVNRLTDAELAEIQSRAVQYNEQYAAAHPYIWAESYGPFRQAYPSELSVPGTDVIGYLEIPSIGVRLPIYHFSSDENMSRGCGHMDSTSLPVGGTDGHAVLLSHRNMATAVTFEHLDRLKEGDTFSVTVLKETVTFEVDAIRVIDPDCPEEYADDRVEEGKERCTLVTCAPNMADTHRLFVSGIRKS